MTEGPKVTHFAAAKPVALVDLAAQQASIRHRLEAAVARVLDHGHYIMGPEVGEVEERLAAFCGSRHAVGCASGTDALALALMALELAPRDAVLVPSFTFAATAEVVAWLGAAPVFVDVEEDSFNLDPGGLEAGLLAARRAGLRAVGVIAVDLFGQPADHELIGRFADAHGLWLIADAAQSFGASWGGRPVGTLAKLTTTSFFPAKPLGCYGDGGAVFCDDGRLAAMLRSLRVHGQGEDKYDNVRIGINGRLDTLQAAILLEKLKIFPEEVVRRQLVADRYGNGLPSALRLPRLTARATSVWAQYTVRTIERDRLRAELAAQSIPTAVYYPRPLHRQTAYARFPRAIGGCPTAERLAREVLSLPMHPYLEPPVQERIIAAVARAIGQGDVAAPAGGRLSRGREGSP